MRNINSYYMSNGLADIKPNPVEVPDYIAPDDELDRVFNEIFSVDPVTGAPRGDVAYYLSSDGNPQIKDWLMNNLLKPTSARRGNPDVSDDMIEEFSKHSDESSLGYISRIRGILDDCKAYFDKQKDD